MRIVSSYQFPTMEALPGMRINTSGSNNMIWTQLRLQRWTGTRWEQFGEIIDASSE
jgi:branched-chain amino acid transport system substrate-binding protein